MRTPVECLNCGLKWVRVIPFGETVYNWDLQYNCPKCGSNYCTPITSATTEGRNEGI